MISQISFDNVIIDWMGEVLLSVAAPIWSLIPETKNNNNTDDDQDDNNSDNNNNNNK